MIDIHNHVIFEIDDGAKSLSQALDMLKVFIEQGVNCIIATPHFRRDMFPYDLDMMNRNYELLKQQVVREGLPIELHQGHEAFLDEYLLENLIEGRCNTLAGSDYVLVEILSLEYFEITKRMLFDLASHGFIPIIAHCERLVREKQDLDKLIELQSFGYYLQVNASALETSKRWLRQWIVMSLENETISFVASDAHNLTQRPIKMEMAYRILSREIGEKKTKEVMGENQRRIIKNLTIH